MTAQPALDELGNSYKAWQGKVVASMHWADSSKQAWQRLLANRFSIDKGSYY